MRIKGTASLIHKLDNQWILKWEQDGIIQRVPLLFKERLFEDGDEIICKLMEHDGVVFAKPV